MLRQIHTGRVGDECYKLRYAMDGSFKMIGIKDTERDIFYDFRYEEDIIRFIRDLNMKESWRSDTYKNIINVFEREHREAEDRFLEMYHRNQELEKKITELEKKLEKSDK